MTAHARVAPLVLVLAATIACARGDDGAAAATDSAAPAAAASGPAPGVAVAGTRPPVDTVGARRVLWNASNAVAALRARGTTTAATGDVAQPPLSGRGTVVQVPGGEVHLFFYGDAAAVARDIARVDTTRPLPFRAAGGAGPPTLHVNNNLIALIYATDAGLRERVRTALQRPDENARVQEP
jgi:hypothetical protein